MSSRNGLELGQWQKRWSVWKAKGGINSITILSLYRKRCIKSKMNSITYIRMYW